eukprot:CAMPEP_0172597910 /NCGR_PEP_ID=MMETSP1068-20121228/17898_1 /TAXON_ID=35684 /ORGANISM="Pseudopedinella elastica, Strain CCMP716" /LENGTH=119 /DNA_ID=CAMNT_0013397569 /DNA_START=521 /DNA_END=880 /DNA_ORIENTATION=+
MGLAEVIGALRTLEAALFFTAPSATVRLASRSRTLCALCAAFVITTPPAAMRRAAFGRPQGVFCTVRFLAMLATAMPKATIFGENYVLAPRNLAQRSHRRAGRLLQNRDTVFCDIGSIF